MASSITPEKQYYQFTKPGSFGVNAIFEKTSDNFKPIVGSWTEEKFKKLSGGQGFDKVVKLNTSIDEILQANPTYKQSGVITPEGSNHEIYGRIKSKDYDLIVDTLNRIKPTKKYKFNFENQFDTDLSGNKFNRIWETDPAYKKWYEKNKKTPSGLAMEQKDHYEIKINPEMSEEARNYTLLHEIAHTYFKNKKIPVNLFNSNKTYSLSVGANIFDWIKTEERNINKDENIADHFADYVSYPEQYKKMYPDEYKWFKNLIK